MLAAPAVLVTERNSLGRGSALKIMLPAYPAKSSLVDIWVYDINDLGLI
jgi:hypothetical protein